ncbi:hypothetical protein GCM10010451_14110 [Streptomyces virens]|uniref:Uncharacterized protein n=1 Tax=Streptomyces virens TaxID=285572 RepID=A0ABP6P4P5_9ACTN
MRGRHAPPLLWTRCTCLPDRYDGLAGEPARADSDFWSHFWSRTLRNWQSELLAVASMAVPASHLRRRASPESEPVAAAHSATGVEGPGP